MATILIAGCGYVGTELAKRLLAANHIVYGIRRNPQHLPEGVIPLALDLATLKASDLPVNFEYVFYLAAADEHSEQAYYQAYQLGLANLLAQLNQAKQQPKRVIFSSSTAVYSQVNGEWVDEKSETEPADFSGKILLAAERTLLQSNFSGVVVRFGGIYGPGRDRLIRSVIDGSVCLSAQPIYTNRMHVADCAGTLLHLMQLKEQESIYLGVDSEPALKNEVLRWLAHQLGKKITITAENSTERELRRNKRCTNQRLLASGYRFIYPTFREGYAELLKSRY